MKQLIDLYRRFVKYVDSRNVVTSGVFYTQPSSLDDLPDEIRETFLKLPRGQDIEFLHNYLLEKGSKK
jgi:hypothetical protein